MNYLSGLLRSNEKPRVRSGGLWHTCGAVRDADDSPTQQQKNRTEKSRRAAAAAVTQTRGNRSFSRDKWSTQDSCGDFVAAAAERLICSVTGQDLLKPNRSGDIVEQQDIGPLTLHYFNVEPFLGRGGKIRAYLHTRGVSHNYTVYDPASWSSTQAGLIRAAISPVGSLPAMSHMGFAACETGAILRYLARLLGEVGNRAPADCLADMSYERLMFWCDDLQRAVWAWITRDVGDDERYAWLERMTWTERDCCTDLLPKAVWEYFMQRDIFYRNAEFLATIGAPCPPTMTPGSEPLPSWVDCLLFATMHDDMTLVHDVRLHLGESRIQQVVAAMAALVCREDDAASRVRRQRKIQRDIFFPPSEALERFPRLAAIYENVFSFPLIRKMLIQLERARRRQLELWHQPTREQVEVYNKESSVTPPTFIPVVSVPTASPLDSEDDSVPLVMGSTYRPGNVISGIAPSAVSRGELWAPTTPDSGKPRPLAVPPSSGVPACSPALQAGAAMATGRTSPLHSLEDTTTGSGSISKDFNDKNLGDKNYNWISTLGHVE